MYDTLFVCIIMCLFELLVLIQIARAVNRLYKIIEQVDKNLVDSLDDISCRIYSLKDH